MAVVQHLIIPCRERVPAASWGLSPPKGQIIELPLVGSVISLSSYVLEQFLLNIPRKPCVLALDCSSTVLSCFKMSAFMFEFNPMSSTQSGKKRRLHPNIYFVLLTADCHLNVVITPTFCVMVGCTVFGLPSFRKQMVIAVGFCSVC